MRKIKFRAWDKTSGEMTLHDSFYELQSWNRNRDELLNYDIEQFTGLRDKNGKEIYEGDIVEMFGHQILQVRVENLITGTPGFQHIHVNYCEIIGNIHENPELLEAK